MTHQQNIFSTGLVFNPEWKCERQGQACDSHVQESLGVPGCDKLGGENVVTM